MDSLILFVTAMVLSMIIVPVMIRIAPRIGMVDLPDPRKVHSIPIPRVGGIGIVIGALVPVILWLPLDPAITSYLFGCFILLVFGVWDDSCELGHYVKFIGQFIAALPVVYYADLYVSVLPVFGQIPDVVGQLFSVIAIVGMINAINHSDGLDGLAGGMSMLSLACISYFMFLANDMKMFLLAISVMGGIFGFLRFNSHPAKVFMGDGGSQFLGFTLGYLAIVLTQVSNPALSPALPLLFLGLPIVDILAVFYLRISGGMNWFKATRNHIHHRLLDLGFSHYESVIIIYLIQMFLIICSILFMYDYDLLILSLYFIVTSSVFVCLTIMERKGVKANRGKELSAVDKFINKKIKSRMVLKLFGNFVVVSIPLIFLIVCYLAVTVPDDIAYMSLFLLVCSAFTYFFLIEYFHTLNKLFFYVTAALVVYLDFLYLEHANDLMVTLEIVIYVLIATSIIFVIKFDDRIDFEMSPTDYLVAIIIIIVFVIFNALPENADYGYSILKLILIYYGCEIVEKRNATGFRLLNTASLLALSILVFRALM